MVEQKFFLRVVMASQPPDNLRLPCVRMLARWHEDALMHPLHAAAVVPKHCPGAWNLRNTSRVAAAARYLDSALQRLTPTAEHPRVGLFEQTLDDAARQPAQRRNGAAHTAH